MQTVVRVCTVCLRKEKERIGMGMKESLMQLREETDKRLAACESAE